MNGAVISLDRNVRLPSQLPDPLMVELRLKPRGAQLEVQSTADLRSLLQSLLATLAAAQNARLVHRDIRSANVIRVGATWLLIDWEVAGFDGDMVFFDTEILPPPVRERSRGYCHADDLWQVGQLARRLCTRESPALQAFADRLCSRSYATAADAQKALQEIRG